MSIFLESRFLFRENGKERPKPSVDAGNRIRPVGIQFGSGDGHERLGGSEIDADRFRVDEDSEFRFSGDFGKGFRETHSRRKGEPFVGKGPFPRGRRFAPASDRYDFERKPGFARMSEFEVVEALGNAVFEEFVT